MKLQKVYTLTKLENYWINLNIQQNLNNKG